MNALDLRILVNVSIFVSLVPALISAIVWRTRKTYPGFGHWTLGNFLLALSVFLLTLRGIAPDAISLVLANSVSITASILFLQGLRRFRSLEIRWWPELLAGAVGLVLVCYFRYYSNDLNVRILVMGIALGGYDFACAHALLVESRRELRRSAAIPGIIFGLSGAAHFFRGFYAYFHTPFQNLFLPTNQSLAPFMALLVSNIARMFGLVILMADRFLLESSKVPVPKPVSPDEVRLQVQRIVVSQSFRRSPRLQTFLTLAVERTLTGDPNGLKEYVLGRDVFNRGEDFDPRSDSIVRVEAQRLRRKLRTYYESDGCDDPVVVEFRPGSYVPRFLPQEQKRL